MPAPGVSVSVVVCANAGEAPVKPDIYYRRLADSHLTSPLSMH